MKNKNSKGEVFYGMHFYPGLAQYEQKGKEPFKVFLNEATIRKMDPTFAGRPVFVSHVNGVEDDIDALRSEADGWVVKSFFNESDGKHWVQFVLVTEDAIDKARNKKWFLSNCYNVVGDFGPAGEWNSIPYEHEIKDAEYEHLALVPEPRYNDTLQIMTPDEFHAYNERTKEDLRRVANTKDKGTKVMFFKREKIQNDKSKEMEGMSVVLPKSKKEVELLKLINQADDMAMKEDKPQYANEAHMVKVGDSEFSVKDLTEKYANACAELMELKKNAASDEEGISEDVEPEVESDISDEESMDNASDEEAEDESEAPAKKAEKKMNAKDKKPVVKDPAAKAKADKLRNAKDKPEHPVATVTFSKDQVARGRELFGS